MNKIDNISFIDYVKYRHHVGYNKTIMELQNERVNNTYFNMQVIQNAIMIQHEVAKVVKNKIGDGVNIGAKVALKNVGEGVSKWVESVSGINAIFVKQILDQFVIPWAMVNAKGPLEALSTNLSQSADELLKADFAFYGPFAECFVPNEPLSPDLYQKIMQSVMHDIEEEPCTNFDHNPFNVGVLSAVANVVRSVTFPIFGSLANYFGTISAEINNDAPDVQQKIYQQIKAYVFSKTETEDVRDELIAKVAQDLCLVDLHSKRYHSEMTDIFMRAINAKNYVKDCAINIKNYAVDKMKLLFN